MSDLASRSAIDLRDALRRGEVTAVNVTEAFLAAVDEKDPAIGAWAFIDHGHALAQAERIDAHRKAGNDPGPLHGLPVGLKDIVDTADMPTGNGTVIDAGRQPKRDAAIVTRLRQAGAVILGKTTTTELAYLQPAETRNPHNLAHTPGGSSAGSAAAVAARMVPLAVGTQTGGSIIRPASFCDIVGFKPSHGLIPRTGVVTQAFELDTIGAMANSVDDAALLVEVLQGYDPGDAATAVRAPIRLLETAQSKVPVTPSLAFVRTPVWEQAEPWLQEAFSEIASELGGQCDEVPLPEVFANAWPAHRTIMTTGFARNLAHYMDRAADQLSAHMREAIEAGRAVSAVDYLAARDWRDVLNRGLDEVFERYDAILTPAAPGEAPASLETTGNPVFNAMWSFLGTPAITLPLLTGPNGMPAGVQLVGPCGDDARLLRTANWLRQTLMGQGE
ncbi:MAG TPA: amidase [Afifellaceae bacterium]|nr:amidase [Afifellaceae bacterium]